MLVNFDAALANGSTATANRSGLRGFLNPWGPDTKRRRKRAFGSFTSGESGASGMEDADHFLSLERWQLGVDGTGPESGSVQGTTVLTSSSESASLLPSAFYEAAEPPKKTTARVTVLSVEGLRSGLFRQSKLCFGRRGPFGSSHSSNVA